VLEKATRAPRPKKKPRGSYHHGDLRQALVDATLAIVEREGTGAVSLSAVARRVGVSPQASYNHFRDKGALLAAAAEETMRALAIELRSAQDAAAGPGERLEAAGIAYVRFAKANPAKFRLLGTPELANKTEHPTLLAAHEDAFGVILDAVDACQKAGLVRKGDTRKLAVAACSTVHGVAHLAVDGLLPATFVEGDPTDLARDAIRALFKGLRAPR
jgi:AcrR family transcriptional regulator